MGDDIIYIITNPDGIDVAFVIVPEGQSIDELIIYDWRVPLAGLNPQTSMRDLDIGLQVGYVFTGAVAFTVAAFTVKRIKRKRKSV